MAEAVKVPVRDNVGAALRFVRANMRFIGAVAAIGAVATALISGLGLVVPLIGLAAGIGTGLIQAFVYAAFIGAVLFGAASVQSRIASDGLRVWAAMVVVGFFLFIVFFMLSIPVFVTLFAGPLGRYAPDLEAAGNDQAAVMSVMVRFAEENPGALLLVMAFYVTIWMLLTSRLYLAAPASVDQGRILTFETRGWTKGSMLRITAARLMLLLPANIVAGSVGYLAGRALGFDALSGGGAAAAAANPAGFALYVLIATFASFALYSALEAALSSYFYRALKPPAASPAG